MKKIYICSPYSDPGPEVMRLRYQRVCKIVAELMREYPDYLFFSPIAHSHGIAKYGNVPGDHEFWMKIDKKWIDWATDVWIADMIGRDESVGINEFEVPYAKETNKPVKWLWGRDAHQGPHKPTNHRAMALFPGANPIPRNVYDPGGRTGLCGFCEADNNENLREVRGREG